VLLGVKDAVSKENKNRKYVLWNVYLPNALHSVCLNKLSCTEVGIYNGANSSRDTEGVPKF